MSADYAPKNIYDLWDDISADLDNKKLTKKRTKYIPSIRQAVEIPPEGTSYNPSIDSYVKYANVVAAQEIRHVRQEKQELELMEACRQVRRKTAKFSEETKVFNEILKPNNETFVETEVVEEDVEQEINVTDEKTEEQSKGPKAKTIKQKRDAKLRRASEKQKQDEKQKKNLDQQVFLIKSIKKSVNKGISEHEKKVAARRQQHALARLVEKKRLGRGKYEEFVEPVLLVDEITGNLRSSKQYCDVLQERLNSLQKRNLIPIGGDSKSCPLKPRLRHKFVEKRTTKEITEDSRVK